MDQKGLNHVKYVLHIFKYMEKMLSDNDMQYQGWTIINIFFKIICPSSQILSLCEGKYHLHTKTLQL